MNTNSVTRYNLTPDDVVFCEEKHQELQKTVEFYLNIRAFIIDNEPGTSYSTHYNLKIVPDYYIRQKEKAERQFAGDIGRYFENMYGLPLRMGGRKLIGDYQFIPRTGTLLSIEDVLKLISQCCNSATDFTGYSITHHLKCFKQIVMHTHCPSKMQVRKNVLQIQHIAWSADSLFHILCLFESGKPVMLPAFDRVPEPRRLDGDAGTWISLEGLQKVEAVRMFKNSRVDVRFQDAGTASRFYQQYCTF